MRPGSPSAALEAAVASLLAPPSCPQQDFFYGGTTRGEVYGLASWLLAALAGRDHQGAVCLATDNRAIIAAALLAALAGGPALLLPYAFSGPALAGMQAATGFTTAITDPDAPKDLPAPVAVLQPPPGATGPALPLRPAAPGRELLRLYTGGSTGTPQLWSKTGGNILGEALFLAAHFGVSSRDRIVATISPAHIYGLLYSVALPLVTGAAVLAATPAFPEEIQRSVRDLAATLLISVPAHYRALRGRGLLSDSLRLAFSSAGLLDREDNAEFCRHHPAGIVEVYGSTETGGIGLRNRSRGERGFTPYPTVAWNIHDQRLHLRSSYLSPGLERDPADFFVTGDRVEPCGASAFRLLGRVDSITKVGGKRVDLEEIRILIKQQPGVSDCQVLALAEGGSREHRIVALVEGQAADTELIRRALAARFEPYALPRTLKAIERLPLTASGKYDRAAMLRLLQP